MSLVPGCRNVSEVLSRIGETLLALRQYSGCNVDEIPHSAKLAGFRPIRKIVNTDSERIFASLPSEVGAVDVPARSPALPLPLITSHEPPPLAFRSRSRALDR